MLLKVQIRWGTWAEHEIPGFARKVKIVTMSLMLVSSPVMLHDLWYAIASSDSAARQIELQLRVPLEKSRTQSRSIWYLCGKLVERYLCCVTWTEEGRIHWSWRNTVDEHAFRGNFLGRCDRQCGISTLNVQTHA